jgi:formate hydrogenlyase transcriptional activator
MNNPGPNRVTSGILITEDITESKQAQEHLRESEEKYRTIIEHAPDGIFLVDAITGQFLDYNRQGLKMFGYSREKLLSFTPVDFSPPVAPDGRPVPEVLQERLASLTSDNQIMFEWVHLHADGHEIPCEVRAVLLPSPDRPVLRASMIDITERKRLEEVFEERLRFQELVSRISTKFIGLSGVELEQNIQDALGEIGRHFEVDAVRLYQLSLQGEVLGIRNAWRSEHLAPEREMPGLQERKYPNFAAHYSQGGSVVFSRFDESPQWPEMREVLDFLGVKAGLGVPLECDGSAVDVFAMDKVLSEHVWPEDIVEHSKAIGNVILSAMRRREAEVELQGRYEEIKQLKDRLEQENIYLKEEIQRNDSLNKIIGDSRAMKSVIQMAQKVAEQETSVLILGETGTGKELLARAIHDMSPRKERIMIDVNCAALPAPLIESELFGREKGAFTGALTKRIGRFEAADGSTIFLDEIGDLQPEMQAKLLRVLQDGKFERLGSTESIIVDVRVIAATNRDLEQEVREGKFRKDLYYRLSVFPITMPPLLDRSEDIPSLVWAFVKEFGKVMGKPIEMIPKQTMEMLQSYSWPGNVRELKNIIERAMILTTGPTLHIDRINTDNLETPRLITLEGVERNHILQVVESTGWRVSGKNGAAELLGLKESTLRTKMGKLGIERKR